MIAALLVVSASAETTCDITPRPSLPVHGHVQTAPTSSNYSSRVPESAVEYLDVIDRQRQGWLLPARVYEYESVSNPVLTPVPILGLGASDYAGNVSRIIMADFSGLLEVEYPATSPNLLAGFVKVVGGEKLATQAVSTSQAFYVVEGKGTSQTTYGLVSWETGDMFVVPSSKTEIIHKANETAVLYWVHDEPLLRYLGVEPVEARFEPTLYKRKQLMKSVEIIRSEPGAENRNRMGILLGNKDTEQTKTLTHTLWALINTIPANTVQSPHKHSSVALDLCISAGPDTYTLMSRQIDSEGMLVDPVRVDWKSGGMFVTPPGWWHSHVNEGDSPGWVLPMQDAGLYTYQRSLDIRFAKDSIKEFNAKRISGVREQF
ncbi:hypothetical protein AAMO2058_000919300 [Amorphochlora amoebiformis]